MPRDSAGPFVQELHHLPDPVRCCELLAGLPYRLFLDSAATDSRLGRYSFLMADPVALIRSKGARTECIDLSGAPAAQAAGVGVHALDAVRTLLVENAAEPLPGLPPFQGGVAGYLAYDWGRVLERLPEPRYDDLAIPDAILGLYDWVLAWDHHEAKAWLVSTGITAASSTARGDRAAARAAAVLDRLGSRRPAAAEATDVATMEASSTVPAAPAYRVDGGWWESDLALRSSFSRDAYLAAVARVREYIYAGDIFQSNISQRFEAPLTEPPWTLYRRLRTRNAAPFAAFFDLPGATILSASPERFLQVDARGRVETRPIKGTRPRGLGPEHDAALGQALTESDKDRAENLMIVDLMRNDLSRVCVPGTVRVQGLFELERYATVHHLVSTIVGQLAPDRDAVDLLCAAFPGGSVTGAPKLRAMEIIAELEPSARGVYCGTIGYWGLGGAVDTNIAIRTAVVVHGKIYFSAGGGIVADSDPAQEYRETLDKARGMIDAIRIPHDPADR